MLYNKIYIGCLFFIVIVCCSYQSIGIEFYGDFDNEETTESNISKKRAMDFLQECEDILVKIENWSKNHVNYKLVECDASTTLILTAMIEEVLKVKSILNHSKKNISDWILHLENMIRGVIPISNSILPEKYKDSKLYLNYRNERSSRFLDGKTGDGLIIRTKISQAISKYRERLNVINDRRLIERANRNELGLKEIAIRVCPDGTIWL